MKRSLHHTLSALLSVHRGSANKSARRSTSGLPAKRGRD